MGGTIKALNPVNAVKKAAGGVADAAGAVADAASDAAHAVADTAQQAAGAVGDTLQSTLDPHSIWDAATDLAASGAQVLYTTTEAIASRVVPKALLQKLPGFRGDVDSHALSAKPFKTVAAAQAAQSRASDALLDVNHWGETLATKPPQRFELYDAQGNKVDRPAQKGDYVKITPLVPGTDDGLPGVKPNWVQIEGASVTDDKSQVVVRPSKDPTGQNPALIAHVFDSRATNTFTVERKGRNVVSSVEGRNEYANDGKQAGNDENRTVNRLGAEALWGSPLRHINIGIAKLTASPQQLLWDSFTHNLVNR